MIWFWIGYIAFVIILLAIDLGVFHRRAHEVNVREAMVWSCVWIAIGLSFSVFIYFAYEGHWLGLGKAEDPVDHHVNDGFDAAAKYLTGYMLEKSLSVDNIFVMALIFGFFAVPRMYQHRVLYWGILGALVLRGVMIASGSLLIHKFEWILYLFGIFLVYTAVRMMFMKTDEMDPGQNWMVRWTRRVLPVTAQFHGNHFLVKAGSMASREAEQPGAPVVVDEVVAKAAPGTLLLTPLALCLIVIEFTDVVFAVDSVPAIFLITADPFLVFTSNVFAILGLRSLYFVLSGMMEQFRYLKASLSLVLLVVGAKMLAKPWLEQDKNMKFYLLGLIIAILATGVISSLVHDGIDTRKNKSS